MTRVSMMRSVGSGRGPSRSDERLPGAVRVAVAAALPSPDRLAERRVGAVCANYSSSAGSPRVYLSDQSVPAHEFTWTRAACRSALLQAERRIADSQATDRRQSVHDPISRRWIADSQATNRPPRAESADRQYARAESAAATWCTLLRGRGLAAGEC